MCVMANNPIKGRGAFLYITSNYRLVLFELDFEQCPRRLSHGLTEAVDVSLVCADLNVFWDVFRVAAGGI